MFRNVKFRTHLAVPDSPVTEVQFKEEIVDGVPTCVVSRGTPCTKIPSPQDYTLSSLVEAKVHLDKVSPNYDIAPNSEQLSSVNKFIDSANKQDDIVEPKE